MGEALMEFNSSQERRQKCVMYKLVLLGCELCCGSTEKGEVRWAGWKNMLHSALNGVWEKPPCNAVFSIVKKEMKE